MSVVWMASDLVIISHVVIWELPVADVRDPLMMRSESHQLVVYPDYGLERSCRDSKKWPDFISRAAFSSQEEQFSSIQVYVRLWFPNSSRGKHDSTRSTV